MKESAKPRIMVKIDRTKIKLPYFRQPAKKTIKEGASKFLNIYKSHKHHINIKNKNKVLESKINLDPLIFEYLNTIKCRPIPGEQNHKVLNEYEPTPGMYSIFTPTVLEWIEEMSFHLHILKKDDEHVFKIKEVYDTESDPVFKALAEERFKKAKKNFTKEIAERGAKFLIPFTKMYDYYGEKNALMLIFVEVIKSQMKRSKLDMKRPSRRRIQNFRTLIHGMIIRNGCHKYDDFFLHLKDFQELFNKAYSSSFTRNFESPSHQSTSSASSNDPSSSTSQFVNKNVYLVGFITYLVKSQYYKVLLETGTQRKRKIF